MHLGESLGLRRVQHIPARLLVGQWTTATGLTRAWKPVRCVALSGFPGPLDTWALTHHILGGQTPAFLLLSPLHSRCTLNKSSSLAIYIQENYYKEVEEFWRRRFSGQDVRIAIVGHMARNQEKFGKRERLDNGTGPSTL